MTSAPLYTLSIIPPAAAFPHIRVLADRLSLISPYISVTDEPHISITGVISDEERIADWISDLREKISSCKPFELPLGPPIRMSGGKFPENFSLTVPSIPELVALSDIIADTTLKHFPELKRRELFSFKDHIYLVQNIPEELRLAVSKEAYKVWKPLTITVDRIWVVRRYAGKLTRQPLYFNTHTSEDLEKFIPDDVNARWMLAVMFARRMPVDDKFGLQKSLFLVDHEQVGRHRYDYREYLHGPYSEDVKRLSETLESLGLMEFDGYMHSLTKIGEKVAGLCYSFLEDYERQWISTSMKKHGDRTGPELVEYVHITYPEWHLLEKAYPDS